MAYYTPIPIPYVYGEWKHIYIPKPDVYNGPDTQNYVHGQRYDEWITNDFSILCDGDDFHIIGITHPRPHDFTDDCHFEPNTVHEAEYQLFHAKATAKNFGDLMLDNSFEDMDKILYPAERPNESNPIWAPQLMKFKGNFRVVYSPGNIRAADSPDFKNWKTGNILFDGGNVAARDPYVYEENGAYYCFYVYDNKIFCRVSRDGMQTWEQPAVILENTFGANKFGPTESPSLIKRGEWYYLFWNPYDGTVGCYDPRAFVYASKNPLCFNGTPIAILPAHSPEIVTDKDGQTYLLSVFHPKNGISAIKLDWYEGWKK